jgi:hypothetical protein
VTDSLTVTIADSGIQQDLEALERAYADLPVAPLVPVSTAPVDVTTTSMTLPVYRPRLAVADIPTRTPQREAYWRDVAASLMARWRESERRRQAPFSRRLKVAAAGSLVGVGLGLLPRLARGASKIQLQPLVIAGLAGAGTLLLVDHLGVADTVCPRPRALPDEVFRALEQMAADSPTEAGDWPLYLDAIRDEALGSRINPARALSRVVRMPTVKLA